MVMLELQPNCAYPREFLKVLTYSVEWFCFYSSSRKFLLLRLAVVFLLSVQLIYVFPNSFAQK